MFQTSNSYNQLEWPASTHTSSCLINCNLITDDGNADALVTEPNTASTHLFPAHVREMHRNRDEGFEREFGVRPNFTSTCCTSTVH